MHCRLLPRRGQHGRARPRLAALGLPVPGPLPRHPAAQASAVPGRLITEALPALRERQPGVVSPGAHHLENNMGLIRPAECTHQNVLSRVKRQSGTRIAMAIPRYLIAVGLRNNSATTKTR